MDYTDAACECAYRVSPMGRLEQALEETHQRSWLVVDTQADWQRVFAFDQRGRALGWQPSVREAGRRALIRRGRRAPRAGPPAAPVRRPIHERPPEAAVVTVSMAAG